MKFKFIFASMEDYQEYFKYAFHIAYKDLKNIETAEDIASQTIYYYILNKKKNNITKDYSWIYKTTKNYIAQYLKEKKKSNELANEIYFKLNEDSDDTIINYVKENYKKIVEYLTDKERKILEIYLKCNLKIDDTAEVLNLSKKNVEKKITFLRKKIKALINQKLGYNATKEIVPPNINRAMLTFLNTIKEAFENNSFHNLKRYLNDEQIDYVAKYIKIKNIKNYEVNLIDGIYKFILFYKDFFDKIRMFSFKLKLINRKFSIFELKSNSNQVIALSPSSPSGIALLKILKRAKRNKDGTLDIPDEILEKIIEESQKEKIYNENKDN